MQVRQVVRRRLVAVRDGALHVLFSASRYKESRWREPSESAVEEPLETTTTTTTTIAP